MPGNKNELLAQTLTAILKKGIPLTPNVLQFMNSTLGITTPAELQEITTNDPDGQADSLMELIFFPDEPLQVQIEPILSQESFTPEDQKKILAHLIDALPQAAILFPNHPQKALIPFPESTASKFLNRLKITKQLHKDLVESLTRHVEPKHVPLVRVKLRNASFSHTTNNISFLCSYFKAFGPQPDDSFDFTLGFLQPHIKGIRLAFAQSEKLQFGESMSDKIANFLFQQTGVNRFQSFLDLTSLRHKLISGNVANVSTPGYRARDLDFKAELARLAGQASHLPGKTTHPGHIPTGQHSQRAPEVDKVRVTQGSLNSVDIDREIPKMAENELMYTIGARLLKKKFDGLQKVITSK